jgi:PhzF family phenazine biosynthesis protein
MPRFYIVDAFTEKAFAGNQAAVVLLDAPAPERWMQQLAAEMGFSETAFVLREGGAWRLRWFTPAREVDLCGHATVASARALWDAGAERGGTIRFETRSGALAARKDGDLVELDFPTAQLGPATSPPDGLDKALGARIRAFVESSGKWLLCELDDERTVRELRPDFAWLKTLDPRTVIVTARGASGANDVVCRYFAPAWGIDEDPATGSIQTVLGPYWAAKLRTGDALAVRQLSARGASMRVKVEGARTRIAGGGVIVVRGEVAGPAGA